MNAGEKDWAANNPWGGNLFRAHSRKETLQPAQIELSLVPYSAADIDSERADRRDSLPYVFRRESARQKDGQRHLASDRGADLPIVDPAGAAQLFHGQIRIARIEKQRVDMSGRFQSLGDRPLVLDVDHLYQLHARQFGPNRLMRAGSEPVDQLDGVGPGSPVVLDDADWFHFAGQQKGGDGRRNRRRNLPDPFIGDDAGAARHRPHQTDGGGAVFDGQPRFFHSANAANLHPGYRREFQ